jgi:hypothetical protein
MRLDPPLLAHLLGRGDPAPRGIARHAAPAPGGEGLVRPGEPADVAVVRAQLRRPTSRVGRGVPPGCRDAGPPGRGRRRVPGHGHDEPRDGAGEHGTARRGSALVPESAGDEAAALPGGLRRSRLEHQPDRQSPRPAGSSRGGDPPPRGSHRDAAARVRGRARGGQHHPDESRGMPPAHRTTGGGAPLLRVGAGRAEARRGEGARRRGPTSRSRPMPPGRGRVPRAPRSASGGPAPPPADARAGGEASALRVEAGGGGRTPARGLPVEARGDGRGPSGSREGGRGLPRRLGRYALLVQSARALLPGRAGPAGACRPAVRGGDPADRGAAIRGARPLRA